MFNYPFCWRKLAEKDMKQWTRLLFRRHFNRAHSPLPHPVLAQALVLTKRLDPPAAAAAREATNGGRRGARAPPPPPGHAAAVASAAPRTVPAGAAPSQSSPPPPPPSAFAPLPRARRQRAGGGGGGAWRGGRVRGRGGVLLLGHLVGALAGGLPRAEHQGGFERAEGAPRGAW